ncbi:cell number regulator 8 [Dendrobium catenatum]|uniref:Cell number regulator 8 n=1 Tax=Dendrobium catenatum TaxID=906689 RepID=A0A2I0VB30_9ASPA|nr:cell number regulator 8 [Dendrobium catenatum]PKU60610.1 Cell number regulator 8 [Dendrobium catenatum]
MANREEEEAAPLLKPEAHNADSVFSAGPKPRDPPPNLAPAVAPAPAVTADCGEKVSAKWAAEGVPLTLAHGSVIGEPLLRDQWDSGLFSCLGRNDEFCSSDLEVCLLGSFAPCVLFGSNAERLGSAPGSFIHNCFTYAGLYMLGNCFFGWNCLAPWLSYPSRSSIRRRFNLEGNLETFARSVGCHRILGDEARQEQLESLCDLAAHVFCHPCALCQEGRELRRRLPHPGFAARPAMVLMPPAEQIMGRDTA